MSANLFNSPLLEIAKILLEHEIWRNERQKGRAAASEVSEAQDAATTHRAAKTTRPAHSNRRRGIRQTEAQHGQQ